MAAALAAVPDIVPQVRLLSIGTHLCAPSDRGDGRKPNWNSPGRELIWSRHPRLWWVENDWTYNGMFDGAEAVALLETLAREGGALGRHIKEVIQTVTWADYFRAGDTPSVLYLIDPGHRPDDPTQPSWAGRFVQPFPQERPRYWTDVPGNLPWDFANPANTWTNAPARYTAAKQTLLDRQPAMYAALVEKVRNLYGRAVPATPRQE